jgi:hypothetical protein
MKKHIKIYTDQFGENPMSELSGCTAQDIHHIIAGGMGGSKRKEDRIENLMALTREEHIKYGDKKKYMRYLLLIHRQWLLNNYVTFDESWFDEKLGMYPE